MTIDTAEVARLLAIAAAVGGVWWRLQQQITMNARALDAYRLVVAEKYASVAHLKEVEARLVVAIDRLTERIDRMLDRIDHLTEK